MFFFTPPGQTSSAHCSHYLTGIFKSNTNTNIFSIIFAEILAKMAMHTVQNQKALIDHLQKSILKWEGYKAPSETHERIGLGPIEAAFPNQVFPLGSIHEMICANTEQATACAGLVSGLLSVMMQKGGVCLWISLKDNIFPPALGSFGISPDRLIFIRVMNDPEALWVMEEALKYPGLAAVVTEVRKLDFKQSRRLQLAVEYSHVTGFVLRNMPAKMAPTASAARWMVKHLPSRLEDDMPGLGFPRWQVSLLKVRNGNPGKWMIEWTGDKFKLVEEQKSIHSLKQKAG